MPNRKEKTEPPVLKHNLDKGSHRRFRRLSLKNTLLFILIVAVLGYLTFIWTNRYNDSNTISSTIPQISTPITVSPKPEEKWWDTTWKTAQRLSVTNLTSRTMPKGETVRFVIDHKNLVDLKKSSSNGSDIRILYQNQDNNFELLNFRIEDANTEEAYIYFELVKEIPSRTEIFNYFLYSNNSKSSSNEFQQNNKLEIFNRSVTVGIDEDLFLPFKYTFSRKWILKGAELPASYRTIIGTVELRSEYNPTGTLFSWQVEGTTLKSIPGYYSGGAVEVNIDPSVLNPGEYILKLKLGEYEDLYDFKVSFPLYATWTMDWEGFDVKNEYLGYMDKIATDNEMPITHYFNPRIFVTNMVGVERRKFLTNWVKDRAEKYGDEISMHLHMHNDFVQAAGVTPRTEVSWSNQGDGYDILTSSYPPEEFQKIVELGLIKFTENGLKKPTGYRAGGWYMNLDNLKVLEQLGFKYDSSGRQPYKFGKNGIPGLWTLKATTRPYKVSTTDQNSGRAPTLNIWEFPNNGSESTNLPGTEMLKSLQANYNGAPLKDKQVITFLSHPHWFATDKPKMEELFKELSKSLAKDDNGPIVYTTLEEAYQNW